MTPIAPLLNTADLAVIFAVTPKTIRRWQSEGRLRAVRVGRELRFRRSDIERLVADDRSAEELKQAG